MYDKMAINTQIWHKAKYYFVGMSNAWYLITVPNMNKITTFLSNILQQTLKMYEKAIITLMWPNKTSDISYIQCT